MQVGIYELGGNSVILEPGGTSWTLEHRENVVMDSDKTEHLKEFVRVLERYVAAIGVRTFAELKDWDLERTEPILSAFEKYATKPIINLESAMHHPCQALADMLTIREKFGKAKEKSFADLGVSSETFADGCAEFFCAGGGAVRTRFANRSSERL